MNLIRIIVQATRASAIKVTGKLISDKRIFYNHNHYSTLFLSLGENNLASI